MIFEIPNHKTLNIKNIVLDFNGTIAKDGKLVHGFGKLLKKLEKEFTIFVITADTNQSAHEELKEFGIKVVILTSNNHTKEKSDFVKSLNSSEVIAFGNGANDELMLKNSALGVCILGDEGCATKTLLNSNITCKNIIDGLELLLNPKRIIATLRA